MFFDCLHQFQSQLRNQCLQYKKALDRLITKEEVACSEYCVCKTTDVNRLDEFSDAPSFSSIFNLVKYLEEFCYLSQGLSVIDFGCDTGHDTFQLAPLIVPGQITGIDVTPETVDYAKETALKLQIENVFFHQSDNFCSISPKSQDLLIMNNVFNIIENKNEIISEASQILKSNGLLIIADVFIIDDLPESLRKDLQFQCGGIAGAKSTSDLINLMNKFGFKVIREEIIRSYNIKYIEQNYQLKSGILIFSVNLLL